MALKLSRSNIILISFGVIVLAVFGVTVYFMFFYERVPVKSIAQQFCECAAKSEVQQSRYEQSKEDFQFASGLYECFGADFSLYDDPLTTEEEEMYVAKINEEIFNTCPELLEKVLKQ